ncbi:phage virion morphogenesis protein [Dechloromonas denitrificans]|uniref:phage virion morphogenesis protein n=1 Tax=Dechloromonas denitrificans TaxID=281362 RepID=UPI001CF7FA51|nr:phage virion morphogenesis protein [Dechloromonas denitrificans]UCV02301.1 phage virion morphogenesis protein [Dechloromonas denitrificans]
MDKLPALEAFAADLLARLEPAARTELARRIARDLRPSQQKRITAQLNPDGTPYTPRRTRLRDKKGSVRRQMFAKLRTTRFLKIKGTPEGAIVAFTEQVSRIARVHQFGLRDKVNRRTGLEVDYPERQLLGITADDEALIRDLAVEYLAR